MKLAVLAATVAVLASTVGPAAAAPIQVAERPKPAQAAVPRPAPLTASDVDAWLDGLMPTALRQGDIPGAHVAVVADGRVLTVRGFGNADVERGIPMDPARTMVKLNSVSKLFTGTAVMQLVERKKVDLDTDVNRYLDFRITSRGKPITLRQLLTHTAGYAETIKSTTVKADDTLPELGDYLRTHTPRQLYAPGEWVSYSNYGVALAGYIVQRVSGESFSTYLDRHVFGPLKMSRTSCLQPPPRGSDRSAARSYAVASEPALPPEKYVDGPAGSCSSTATDMAAFMLAHLGQGRSATGQILATETARRMHAPQVTMAPGRQPNSLSFFGGESNGQKLIGHGGDGFGSHNDLNLIPARGVGIYVGFNGDGGNGATYSLRPELLRGFMDRYFPAAPDRKPTLATAKAHAELAAGTYTPSRRTTGMISLTRFMTELTVTANEDGTISTADLITGRQRTYHEIAPHVWQDVAGADRIGMRVANGRVTAMVMDPTMTLLRAAPEWSNAVTVPVLISAIVILLVTALGWPISALLRRRYGVAAALPTGQALLARRLTLAGVIANLLLVASVLGLLLVFMSGDSLLTESFDPVLRGIQAIGLLGLAGAGAAIWSATLAWTGPKLSRPTWWGPSAATLVALAGLTIGFFAVAYEILGISLAY